MPLDYSKYHPDWKTVIRPAILARAEHKCENCKVKNHIIIIRGNDDGRPIYQDDDGTIYDGNTSERIGDNYVGDIENAGNFIKVVLTIAHLDHNIENNDYGNLKALCQRCHLLHDRQHHKATRKKKKNQIEIW